MATSTAFKQQCPSCEAMVPIKDVSLIGRKIDCPKCKYRFLVEEPEAAEDEEGEDAPRAEKKEANKTRPGKNGAVQAKGPARDKADGKTKPDKKKSGADEGDEAGASSAKKGGKKKKPGADSSKMKLGLALAGVGVAVLGVAAYFMFFNKPAETNNTPIKDVKKPDDKDKKDKGGDKGGDKPEEKDKPVEGSTKAQIAAVPFTNLLLRKTDYVAHFHFQEILSTSLGNLLLSQFPDEYIKSQLGFSFRNIDQVIRTVSYREKWGFTVVHLKDPLPWDAIVKAMDLKEHADSPIKTHKYFFAKNKTWVNSLARLSLTKPADSAEEISKDAAFVHQYDGQTLVMGDLVAIKQFLNADRKPEKAKAKVPDKKQGPPNGPPNMPLGGPNKPPMGNGRPDMPMGGPKGPPMGKGSGNPNPNPMPADKDQEEDKKEEQIPAKYQMYLTIDEDLRDMLVRLDNLPEKSKDRVLCKAAISYSEPDARRAFKQVWDITQWFPQVPPSVTVAGAALLSKDESVYTFRSGIECDKEESAQALAGDLQNNTGPDFARFFTSLTGIKMAVVTDEKKDTGRGPVGPMGGPVGPMGGPVGPMGGGSGRPMGGPERPMGPMGGPMRPQGGPMGPMGPNGPNRPGPNMENPQGGGDELDDKEEEKDVGGIIVRQSGKRILLRMKVVMNAEEKVRMEKLTTLVLHGLRGDLDSLARSSQLQRLGDSVKKLGTDKQKFPRAALFRPVSPARSNYNWEPDQRISWMAELLPYLGHQALYGHIDSNRKYSWSDNENIVAARTSIPEFLDPSYPLSSQYVSYPGLRLNVAATHFVGIAGIGEDSADEADMNAAGVGILGYERETPLSFLKKGAANTALLVQIPADQASPWMAGGGSTVRGIPATQSIRPFVVPHLKGTYVLMADGSVRFVKETISDEVFKAMAPVNGPVVAKQRDDDWTLVGAKLKAEEKPPAIVPKPQPIKPVEKPVDPKK